MKKNLLIGLLTALFALVSASPAFAESSQVGYPAAIHDAPTTVLSSLESTPIPSTDSTPQTVPPASDSERVPAPSDGPTLPVNTPTPSTESPLPEISPAPSVTPESTATVPPAITLFLDSSHIYGEMDRAFENGYTPKIVNHQTLLTLPVKCSGALQNDRIMVSLEFGPTSDKAFVAASYEKNFSLTQAVPNNGSSPEQLFLVSFSVQMLTERINGVYPVTAHIRAVDLAGNPVRMDYTVFVSVADGRPSEPSKEPQPTPDKPSAEPVVYIQKCVVSPADVQAGEPFTVTLTLKNSVKTKRVQNLLVTVDTGDLKIDLLENSNVFPIDTIKGGGTAELVLHCKAQPSLPAGKHPLHFAFQYNTNETLNLSSQGQCILNTRQTSELSYDGARLPQKVISESTVTVQTNLMNTGKSVLYNCRMDIAMDGLDAGGTSFVGEIPPGESKIASANLRVSSEKLGEVDGLLTITYEDDYGQTFTKTAALSSNIVPKPEPAVDQKTELPSGTKMWWLFLLVGLVIGCGASLGISLMRKNALQRKEDDLRL